MFYYNFLTVLIIRVGILKGINFNSGLNIYGIVIFSDNPIALKLWRFSKMICEFFCDIFSLRMRTNGYLGASGVLFTKKIIKVLLMISGTHDKLTTMTDVSLENLLLQLKTKTRFSTPNSTLVQFVCHLALEGFVSFYNDVNYDEVTKTHNVQLCALDEGPFNLKMPTKRIDMQVAPVRLYTAFFQGLMQLGLLDFLLTVTLAVIGAETMHQELRHFVQ